MSCVFFFLFFYFFFYFFLLFLLPLQGGKKGSGRGKKQAEESIGEAREARPLGRLWRISPRRRFNIYPYERRLRNLSSPLCSTCQSFPPVSRVVCALYLTLTRALYPRCSPSCSLPRILSAVSAGWRAKEEWRRG